MVLACLIIVADSHMHAFLIRSRLFALACIGGRGEVFWQWAIHWRFQLDLFGLFSFHCLGSRDTSSPKEAAYSRRIWKGSLQYRPCRHITHARTHARTCLLFFR